jgi:hypothetical protein
MASRNQKNHNSVIADCLRKKKNIRSILYIEYLKEMSGSINAALFLSQLLYWQDKGKTKGWVYKTIADMQSETGLSKGQQATAIEIWKKADILEVGYTKTTPPKRNFRINMDVLLKFLDIEDIYPEEWKK